MAAARERREDEPDHLRLAHDHAGSTLRTQALGDLRRRLELGRPPATRAVPPAGHGQCFTICCIGKSLVVTTGRRILVSCDIVSHVNAVRGDRTVSSRVDDRHVQAADRGDVLADADMILETHEALGLLDLQMEDRRPLPARKRRPPLQPSLPPAPGVEESVDGHAAQPRPRRSRPSLRPTRTEPYSGVLPHPARLVADSGADGPLRMG